MATMRRRGSGDRGLAGRRGSWEPPERPPPPPRAGDLRTPRRRSREGPPDGAPPAPRAHAVPAPYVGTPVAHGLGLPEAATYVAPPVRTVAEAPIVEQVLSFNEDSFVLS